MDHKFCPGSKMLRQPAPESFDCPKCGNEVEIWTDELKRNCHNCGTTVMRETNLSCLEWCAKAADCIGDEAYADYLQNRITSIRHRLLDQIRSIPDIGPEMAKRAECVAGCAAELSTKHEVDWHIVLPASILHEVEPETARKMLFKEGLPLEDIHAIISIVSGNGNEEMAKNSRVVLEAARTTTPDSVVEGVIYE